MLHFSRRTLTASLLTAGLVAQPLVAWAEGKTWAVVVGIDEYTKTSIPALRYAVADAKLFSQALQTVVHVPKENIILMTSDTPDEKLQPKLTNVAYYLGWLREKVGKEDTIIFYFAGHGLTMDGQSYLLTEEADNRNAAALKFSALRGSDLTDLLKAYSAKRALVILDACRNNPASKSDNKLDQSFSSTLTLPSGSGSEQSATMFSCKVGEKSWEWDEKKHGFYTYFLVEGLRQNAAGSDGKVTLGSLNQYVVKEVAGKTGSLASSVQTPNLAYVGTDQSSWLLATVQASNVAANNPAKKDADSSKFVAELEAARARLDAEIALRKAAEERANREESRRREVEQALAILEKQSGGVAAKSSPAVPQMLAYADRGSVGTEDEQKKALESEVRRLRAENDALKSRLSAIEKSVSMNSREVTLDSERLDKKWAEAAVARADMDRKWAAGALAALTVDKGTGAQASAGASDSRVRLEQSLRDSLAMHLELVEKSYGKAMEEKHTQVLATRPPAEQKAAVSEMAFLRDQLEAQRQVTLSSTARIGAAECALVDSRQRLAEAETRIAKYEAIIKDLQGKLKEAEAKLAELDSRRLAAEAEAKAANERANVAQAKLVAMENKMDVAYKGTPMAADWRRVTRRARFSDLGGIIDAGAEATELPPK